MQVEFLRPLTVSILSERRALQPFGLNGGQPGSRGINLLIRKNGVVNLGSKSTVAVEAGDRLKLLTPGAKLATSFSSALLAVSPLNNISSGRALFWKWIAHSGGGTLLEV